MNKEDMDALRREFLDEIKVRLIGPADPEEELREKPQKRYLTGMLFPRGANAQNSLRDESDLGDDEELEEETPVLESPMDMLFQKLPASVGLTFALTDAETAISVEVFAATYIRARATPLVEEASMARRPQGDAGENDANHRTGRAAEEDLAATAARGDGEKVSVDRPAHGPLVWKRQSLMGRDRRLDGDMGNHSELPEVIEFDTAADGRQTRKVLKGRASCHLFLRRSAGRRIATVSLVNERQTAPESPVETEDVLFQVAMTCVPRRGITAYPDPPRISADVEAEELALQYRFLPTFAVGHGCGAAWGDPSSGAVEFVALDFLPAVEVPPVTTDIESLPREVKESLSLVNLQNENFDPAPGFRKLHALYLSWCEQLRSTQVEERFEGTKRRIIARIERATNRINDGIGLLERDADAMRVFRLANQAMLLAAARTASAKERASGTAFKDVDIARLAKDAFVWRPFQVAFLLLSLNGLWEASHPDRDVVDLIWFPTGGGKTEAYLGVAAFEMIRRRLRDGARGAGTAVIKRYTLRLLTIQQFERAGSLICALETMRRQGKIAGAEFSLGLWVGKDSSPNDYASARADLRKILQTTGRVEGVKVPLKNCPVCGTAIVPQRKNEGADGVGIRDTGSRIELGCPERSCSFADSLPISFVDDFLYDHPPTMLLGTVDKFAMLAWRDEARAFFGNAGQTLPPSLIIQDELHLISGPLGTLAGVYEAAIDTLVTRSGGRPPKYVAATATIRRADDQVRKLYARECALFPPPGLNANDSFFSRVQEGVSGRLYVGAMGQGHTPTFSNVIASAALLAAAGAVRKRNGDIADTWWTLVSYHNSKRELGKTLTLARDDIPARLLALGEPRTIAGAGVRELSANLKDSEIPDVLHQLGTELPGSATLDFVACTNMLSVGVDIQRLGLMMINGQPKTVSEYIQASSRIGRDRKRPPGIVLTLFSPTKPRDRSHYEFFRAFHKGFYRHVEPTSVTPFAPPSQDRGLHGALLALVRMISSVHANNRASSILQARAEINSLAEDLLDRVSRTGDGEREESRACLYRFIDWWEARAKDKGTNLRFQSGGAQHSAVIRPFNTRGDGWETLQSLRHVDIPLQLLPPVIQVGDIRGQS